ncbi:ABC transporter ATP-binding protein [Methylomonas sp. LL1]|uniref:ABC transporter ATP-binding protein n=1 Tax=Methylomonas sp. LL1 TaxID=2785785 RepID=UPI0018C4110C|nr:ABC transporter ATP-binding protein [Methylomonas sp. LL1]QPK64929.1 ABC transporter ATP-binding protein [Methylomonas sp. LL1]
MSFDIKVENLSKIYNISHKGNGRATMRETIELGMRNAVGKVFRRPSRRYLIEEVPDSAEKFKALDDVSFEVAQGERLAIIGQNGAGKSTLLKILSRITEPTSGRIQIRGRVAALLEVGTGFHPELTGRENIYMNGAVLGMPKSEIKKKFDEIVDFSEIEKFLDTPVKYYSSGMYVRLAFSVAAHLDPEVLILDEVLAVGDLRFQQKCLDRMQYASNEGRTILFVSHNVQSVNQICPRTVLLEHGIVKAIGPTADVVQEYIGASFVDNEENRVGNIAEYRAEEVEIGSNAAISSDAGDRYARLRSAAVCNEDGDVSSTLLYHQRMFLEMEYEVYFADGASYIPNFHVYNVENVLVFIATPPDCLVPNYEKGIYKVVCEIPRCLLNEGVFRVTLALSSWKGELVNIHFLVPHAMTFKVVDDFTDVSYRNGYMHVIPGMFRPQFSWNVGKIR